MAGIDVSESMTIASIDPGLGGTGVAIWQYDKFRDAASPNPMLTKSLTDKHYEGYYRKLQQIFLEYGVKAILIENQAFMTGSVVGNASAKTGSVVKLAHFTGMVMGLCMQYGINHYLVDVSAWKGQLPKKVTWDRMRAAGYTGDAKSHAMDAVGIGMWAQGLLHPKKVRPIGIEVVAPHIEDALIQKIQH